MARLTLKTVNKALAEAGYQEKLYRDPGGWFYFYDGDASDWYDTIVMTYRLNDLTLEQWLENRDYLASRRVS